MTTANSFQEKCSECIKPSASHPCKKCPFAQNPFTEHCISRKEWAFLFTNAKYNFEPRCIILSFIFKFFLKLFLFNCLKMKMHEMGADSWGINYKIYATVRNGNAQSCWKESLHILSERMKLANILTAKGTRDRVVGLQKCFFWAKSCEQSCFLQTAGSSLWKSTGKNIQRSDSVSTEVSKRFPVKTLAPQNLWGVFSPFVVRDIWSSSILHIKAETLLKWTDATEFQHN